MIALLPARAARQRQPVPLGRVRRLPAPHGRSARRRQVALHPADPRAWASSRPPTRSSARASTLASVCTPAAPGTHSRPAATPSRSTPKRSATSATSSSSEPASSPISACGPSCAQVEQHIARWADRYEPAPGERLRGDLLRHPYLGPGFEFTREGPRAGALPAYALQLHVRLPLEPGLRRRQHLGHEVLDPAPGGRHHRARSSSRIARRTSRACAPSPRRSSKWERFDNGAWNAAVRAHPDRPLGLGAGVSCNPKASGRPRSSWKAVASDAVIPGSERRPRAQRSPISAIA